MWEKNSIVVVVGMRFPAVIKQNSFKKGRRLSLSQGLNITAVTRDEIPRLTQDHATSLRAELNKSGVEPNPGPGLSYRHLTALKVNGQETESD